ncbi:MAG: hypothetical protein FWE57_06440 [Chitinispirillia bacterium]|nr:hypothetical protein [Chitinispirillia bacterium]
MSIKRVLSVTIALFAVFLLNSCAMVPIHLGAKYQRMALGPTGSERAIDRVELSGDFFQLSGSNGYPPTPSPKRMGASYSVFEREASQRHRDEVILNRLLNEAQRMYPNEAIDIRNATERAKRIGTRTSSGTVNDKVYTSYISQFRTYYTAEIVIAEPMPHPPSHTIEIPLIGVSRDDLYRRAHNLLIKDAAVRIAIADFHLGRLQGEYNIVITHGLTYLITSAFTIDIHDERAYIRFENPRLRRDGSRQDEPIFLQSIANRVQTEMGVFSENLKRRTSSLFIYNEQH